VKPVPESTKSEIITKYLEGFSTLEIHKLMNVSIGTISAVTAEAARKDNSIS
jgi:DNA-directed RNA polymerase specialized sigma24 family protein